MPEKSTLVILVMLFRFKSLQRETQDEGLDFHLNLGRHARETEQQNHQKNTSASYCPSTGGILHAAVRRHTAAMNY